MALLRELNAELTQGELEPMGELLRSGLAAVALWWLDHPEVPREMPLSALARMIRGLIEAPAHRREA